MAERIILN